MDVVLDGVVHSKVAGGLATGFAVIENSIVVMTASDWWITLRSVEAIGLVEVAV